MYLAKIKRKSFRLFIKRTFYQCVKKDSRKNFHATQYSKSQCVRMIKVTYEFLEIRWHSPVRLQVIHFNKTVNRKQYQSKTMG